MKLSIITINFNNLAGLQRTYESVVCQTFTDYEWIVIDGGSTDGSREFIEQHQDKFAYWCSEPDKGIYNAMNKGIAKAHGVYVNFMNSGDCFHSAEVLMKVFSLELFADILIGQVSRVGTDKIDNVLCEDNIIIDFGRVRDGFCHQGTFTKLYLLQKYPFDETLKIVSDWKFWLQTIVLNNCKIQPINIIVADYDLTGISSICTTLMWDERKMVFDELFPPMLLKEFDDYSRLKDDYKRLKNSEFVIRSEYLLAHCPTFYVMGRRFLAFLIKISNLLGK